MWSFEVPNAPCGVESLRIGVDIPQLSWFLMHRVELKERKELQKIAPVPRVPNAPCGVERQLVCISSSSSDLTFLMHRVELKVVFSKVLSALGLKPCS